MQKIAIIGAGNLGVALAEGIRKGGLRPPQDIVLSRRNIQKLESPAAAGFGIAAGNCEAVRAASIVFICVQPKQVIPVLQEIDAELTPGHVLVSTVTGVSIEEMAASLSHPNAAIVRAMPNTAVGIGASMTCLCARNTTDRQLQEVLHLLGSLGEVLVIEERLMKAATVLAASGIAFCMRYLRAATQAGIQLGFDAEAAQQLAVQTAKGAALLIQQHRSHPEMEIDRVTTPEGCTIAGLNEMEHQGLSSALIKGILTSFEKINSIRK
jgi:pyrroline-5-carboxylate reductase